MTSHHPLCEKPYWVDPGSVCRGQQLGSLLGLGPAHTVVAQHTCHVFGGLESFQKT